MTLYIVPIVEGHTEQGCIERLLQRIWRELLGQTERLQVEEPIRRPRDQLAHPNGLVLTGTMSIALIKLRSKAKKDTQARPLVLILLDAEGDCPKALAPRLLDVARKALPADVPVSCVLAKRMLENWIVAGASALEGVNGLPDNLKDKLPARGQFEDRSGAAWLEAQLRSQNKTRKYSKTDDAKEFVREMALQECRANAASFDKLCQVLEAVLPLAPIAEPTPEPPAEDGQ
jgi:hypothetical protein